MGGLFTYPKTMSSVLVYPVTELVETDYHAFNAKLWDHLVADQSLAALDFRIDTPTVTVRGSCLRHPHLHTEIGREPLHAFSET